MPMRDDEISGAIGNVAVHLLGWLVVGPIFGAFFGLFFLVATWFSDLGLTYGQCYTAGWAMASVLYSVEIRACARRQLTVVNNGGFPPIPPSGWN